MIAIVISFAFGSVVLGIVLGKLLKRSADTGTMEPPDASALSLQAFDRIPPTMPPRAARTALIVKSSET